MGREPSEQLFASQSQFCCEAETKSLAIQKQGCKIFEIRVLKIWRRYPASAADMPSPGTQPPPCQRHRNMADVYISSVILQDDKNNNTLKTNRESSAQPQSCIPSPTLVKNTHTLRPTSRPASPASTYRCHRWWAAWRGNRSPSPCR